MNVHSMCVLPSIRETAAVSVTRLRNVTIKMQMEKKMIYFFPGDNCTYTNYETATPR